MKRELFSDAMGEIGEAYILEALDYRPEQRVIRLRRWRSVAACILLGLFLGGSLVLAVSPEARAAVFGWVRRQNETFYEYTFEGEPEKSEEIRYMPQWIPEGYELESAVEIANGEVYTYYNEEGKWLVFTYLNASESSKVYAEGTDFDEFDVEINGDQGTVYIEHNPEDLNLLVWTDSETGTLLYVTGWLDKDALITFAENVLRENSGTGPKKYNPSWVPDDCTFMKSYETAGGESFIYSNERGMLVQFTYISEPKNEMLSIDSVPYKLHSVMVNDDKGEVGIAPNDTETNYILWTDADTNALFLISGDYDEGTLIKMAENFIERPSEENIPKYCPGWMPEGYELVDLIEIENGEMYVFFRGTEEVAQFSYNTAPSGMKVCFEGVGYEQHKVLVNGLPAETYLSPSDQQSSEIIWWDESGKTMFTFSARVSEEDLIRFAENIREK